MITMKEGCRLSSEIIELREKGCDAAYVIVFRLARDLGQPVVIESLNRVGLNCEEFRNAGPVVKWVAANWMSQ